MMKENEDKIKINYVNPKKDKWLTPKRVARDAVIAVALGVFIGTGGVGVVKQICYDIQNPQTGIEQTIDASSISNQNAPTIQSVHR